MIHSYYLFYFLCKAELFIGVNVASESVKNVFKTCEMVDMFFKYFFSRGKVKWAPKSDCVALFLLRLGVSDAQIRVLKAKLGIMQEELDQFSCEYYKKVMCG